MSINVKYESIEQFYAQDERRRHSGEVDFGVWWKDYFERNYRVSWVRDTGEVYAVALSAAAVIKLDPQTTVNFGGDDTGMVEVLATIESIGQLEARLDGWADMCGRANSLAWVRERLS